MFIPVRYPLNPMLSRFSPVECPGYAEPVCEPTPALEITLNSEEPGVLGSHSNPHLNPHLDPHLNPHLNPQKHGLLQFDFSQLSAFTPVHHQYHAWGVDLEGAIAIRPSNPAFINAKHTIGLMPTVSSQPLTIYFQQLRQLASISIASSQQITVKAYNAQDQLVTEQRVGQSDYCQSRQTTSSCAHHQVQLTAIGMARLEISSDSPFLLHDLICG